LTHSPPKQWLPILQYVEYWPVFPDFPRHHLWALSAQCIQLQSLGDLRKNDTIWVSAILASILNLEDSLIRVGKWLISRALIKLMALFVDSELDVRQDRGNECESIFQTDGETVVFGNTSEIVDISGIYRAFITETILVVVLP
jgi:hypothetical protein